MKYILLLILLCSNILNLNAQCWQSVEAGSNHVLAIRTDGTLWTWGWNEFGQVGNGTNINTSSPVQIGTATTWKSITGGYQHSLAIKGDHTLWAWGKNSYGELGIGTNINTNTPVQVGTSNDWQSVSAGFEFTIAKKIDGTLWAWGRNNFGNLGDGTYTDRNTPIQIGTATNWQSLSTGEYFSLAKKTDGTIWSWGMQVWPNPPINIPTQVGIATNWSNNISTKLHSRFALTTSGKLWAWHDNFYGQLGNGLTAWETDPILIGASAWRSVVSGWFHTLGIKTDGTLWAWGRNAFYTYGNNTNIESHIPVQIGTGTNWQLLSGGETNSYAIKTDGTLWATGYNNVGQVGDGTFTDKTVFTQIVCSGVLPINLFQFSATKQGVNNLLFWQTATENNSKGFQIQRSYDGINFSDVSFVNSLANSASIKNYNYTDVNPGEGKIYYRLKLVDNDNRFNYSNIVVVNNSSNEGIAIYPNPAIDLLHIQSNRKINHLSLINLNGQFVKTWGGNNANAYDLSGVSSGMYFIKIYVGTEVIVQKIRVR